MGQQIIKQPNGKYAVFSSVVDAFVLLDAEQPEVFEHFIDAARRQAERDVARVFEKLDKGQKPYYQFTMTFDEAAQSHIERFPDDVSAKWVAAISAGVELEQDDA